MMCMNSDANCALTRSSSVNLLVSSSAIRNKIGFSPGGPRQRRTTLYMLDEEQRRRIEENRRKALEKLSQKAGGMLPSATKVDAPQSNTMGSGSTNPVQPPPVISTAPFVPFVPAQPDPPPPKPSSIVASNPPLVATAPAWNTTQRTSPAKAPPKPPEKVSLQLESAETFSCAHVAHLYEAVKSIPGFKMVPGKTAGGTGGTWSIPLKHYNAFRK